MIQWTGIYAASPSFWSVSGSFFGKSYWHWDRSLIAVLYGLWEMERQHLIGLTHGMVPHWQLSVNPRLSLCDAYPIRANLHGNLNVPSDISFSQATDKMEWKWSNTGVYSARSIYEVMMGMGMIKPLHVYTWKLGIPPTVRIFIYLLLKQKILTKDVMQCRNMGSDLGCEMCGNCPWVRITSPISMP